MYAAVICSCTYKLLRKTLAPTGIRTRDIWHESKCVNRYTTGSTQHYIDYSFLYICWFILEIFRPTTRCCLCKVAALVSLLLSQWISCDWSPTTLLTILSLVLGLRRLPKRQKNTAKSITFSPIQSSLKVCRELSVPVSVFLLVFGVVWSLWDVISSQVDLGYAINIFSYYFTWEDNSQTLAIST